MPMTHTALNRNVATLRQTADATRARVTMTFALFVLASDLLLWTAG
jgi:hypothetical protein